MLAGSPWTLLGATVRLDPGKAGSAVVPLTLATGRTPYVVAGDWMLALSAGVIMAALVAASLRAARRPEPGDEPERQEVLAVDDVVAVRIQVTGAATGWTRRLPAWVAQEATHDARARRRRRSPTA